MKKIARIYKNKDNKVLLTNFFSLGVIKFMDMVIPLLLIPILISKVGITNYGRYAYAYAFVFYFLNLTQYGFSISAVRDISINRENTEKINKIWNDVVTTKMLLCLLSILLIVFFIFLNDDIQESELYFYLILLLIADSFSANWFFQGVEKMKMITIVNILSKSTFILFIFLFVNDPDDYKLIGLAQGIGFIVAGILSIKMAMSQYKLKFRFSDFRAVKNQLQNGFSAFMTTATPLLYANSSVFLTGYYGIPQYVSFVEIGVKISGGFTSLNNIIAQVFYPYVNRKKSKTKLARVILLSVGMICTLFMFFIAPYIINIWLPKNAESINTVVRILSLSPFFISLSSAYGLNGLMVYNKDSLYSKIILFSSIIGLVFSILFIPQYFHIAAAISFVMSRGLIGILAWIAYKIKVDGKE